MKDIEYSFEFDKYLELPIVEAYRKSKDEKNLKTLRKFAAIAVYVFGFFGIVTIFSNKGSLVLFFVYLACALIMLIFQLSYRKFVNLANIRKIVIFFLVSFIIGLAVIDIVSHYTTKDTTSEDSAKEKVNLKKGGKEVDLNFEPKKTNTSTNVIFTVCIVLLFFKLSRNDIVQLYTIGFGIPILTELVLFGNFNIGDKIASFIIAGMFFTIAITSEIKRRKKFTRQLELYSNRHRESRRMKRELDYAREIQLSMLPESKAKFGDIEIAAVSIPTYEVGGDYFDYFRISDTLLGIFICDVSGHGVASALLLSGLRSCMHLILEDTNDPKEIFIKLNKMVRKTQSRKMFVTAIFALIDTEKNICRMYNAGHTPPYKISGDSFELFKIKKRVITLGAMDSITQDIDDSEVVFDFRKNDKLVLYTDGVSEAMNAKRDEYGFEKLENFLNANADKSPSLLLNNLVDDVKYFIKETEQKDDMSILIIGRN